MVVLLSTIEFIELYFIYEILWNLHLSFLFYVEYILVCNVFIFVFAEKGKWKRKNSSSKENHWRRVVGKWKTLHKIWVCENTFLWNLHNEFMHQLISFFKMEINRKEEMTKRRKMLQMELMVWNHTKEVIKHNWLDIFGCF